MITLIGVMVSWAVYAQYEGIREAYYWDAKNRLPFRKLPIDEHFLWTCQRSAVFILAIYTVTLKINDLSLFYLVILSGVSLMLTFPFIHDGFMYKWRSILNNRVYPKGFWDQSTTSTAKLTKYFTPVVRTICFVVGLITYGVVIYLAL